MNYLKKIFTGFALVLGFTLSTSSQAGIPVIDAASLAQSIQQVAAWSQQYQQMVSQIEQQRRTFESGFGVRNMGSLVNNPASRQYLPAEYQQILRGGVGQWEAIRNASRRFDVATTRLAPDSDTVQVFQQNGNQAAINRASAEMAYSTASQRFADIQVLLDRVNNAPDAKDMADLQGRIQAEQTMMQNEANKLQSMALLAQAQRDIQAQQSREIRMKSTRGGLPSGW